MRSVQEEPTSTAWVAYKADPCRQTFGQLLSNTPETRRQSVVANMQKLFFETEHWKVAQHLALILTGVHYPDWPSDHVAAEYFAACARQLSGEDPLAAILAAWVHWHRRLPAAVMSDLAHVDQARGEAWPSNQFAAEYHTLLAMSQAYMGRPSEAWATIQKADAFCGTYLTAVGQLMHALKPGDVLLETVAMRVVEHWSSLTPREAKLVGDAVRKRFLSLLLGGRNVGA